MLDCSTTIGTRLFICSNKFSCHKLILITYTTCDYFLLTFFAVGFLDVEGFGFFFSFSSEAFFAEGFLDERVLLFFLQDDRDHGHVHDYDLVFDVLLEFFLLLLY